MSEELESLRAEVAALRAEVAEGRRPDPATVTRRRLLTGLAGLGAAGAASIAAAPSARAADGDPLIIGESNDATTETFLTATYTSSESEVVLASEPWGVMATAQAIGVLGSVEFGGVAGVWGEVSGANGSGVTGNAADTGGVGVMASSEAGPAFAALSRLDGVTLELTPAERSGPPSSMPTGLTDYRIGAVSVDEDGELWLCTSTGAPGTWTRLLREDTTKGRVVPITPIRAIDTRAAGGKSPGGPVVPGQVPGPLRGGQTVTLDLAGVSPIPATASGVIGNATVIDPGGTGFLRIRPAGATVQASSFNFYSGRTGSNGFTSALSPNGLSADAPVSSGVRYHLVIDIAAYIT